MTKIINILKIKMMLTKPRIKKIALLLFLIAAIIVVFVICLNIHFHHSSEKYIS